MSRWAAVALEEDVWVVELHSEDPKHTPTRQEFARFDNPALQLYIYRWCLEGVVCL